MHNYNRPLWKAWFVRNLREIMNERGLTEKELARMCYLSKSTINRIIRGYSTPTVKTVVNLSNGLGIPMDRLLFYKGMFRNE